MLACERGMPVRFFTASSPVMRLRRARDENRLDAELRAIGRARLLVIDELVYLPIGIDGARLLFQVVADSYEKRSVVSATNLEFGRWARCSATATWPPRSSTASCITEGSSGSVASRTATATP